MRTSPAKYLLVPLPKTPYSRIGPTTWQDYYVKLGRTAKIARNLMDGGNQVTVAIISAFQPPGKPSEIDIYCQALRDLAPELTVRAIREATETVGQIERSFRLAQEMNARVIFISTWMHYPRVRYLARGKPARHYGAFGIPQPAFLFLDPLFLIFQPLGDLLGMTSFLRRAIIRERERGRIL